MGDLTRDYYLHLGASVDPANTIPAPLVLDFPGWCVEAEWQMVNKPWPILADTEPAPGLIYVTMEGMNDVENATYPWNSWNHSSTNGPKGLTCDPELVMYVFMTCHFGCLNLKSLDVNLLTSGIIGDLATLPVQTFGMVETVTIPMARVIGSPVMMTSPSLKWSFMTSWRGTVWTRSRFTSQGCPMAGCSYGVESWTD